MTLRLGAVVQSRRAGVLASLPPRRGRVWQELGTVTRYDREIDMGD